MTHLPHIRISVLSLLVCATTPDMLSAKTIEYWATGVTKTSGWTSIFQGGTNMCWAATSSNLLSHYLKNAEAHGLSISENAMTSETDIYNWFCAKYGTAYGGYVHVGLHSFVDSHREFFNGVIPEVSENWTWKNDYGHDNGVSYAKLFLEALSNGSPVGISWMDTFQDVPNHAVTVWGIEYNTETQRVSKLWITDSSGSNDKLITYKEFVYNGGYYITEDSGESIANGNYRIYDIDWLKFPTIPEPSTFGLLAGTLALVFAVARRRRSRKA